jgi:hypothetical protein
MPISRFTQLDLTIELRAKVKRRIHGDEEILLASGKGLCQNPIHSPESQEMMPSYPYIYGRLICDLQAF